MSSNVTKSWLLGENSTSLTDVDDTTAVTGATLTGTIPAAGITGTIDNVTLGSSVTGFPVQSVVQMKKMIVLSTAQTNATRTVEVAETVTNCLTGVVRGNKVIAQLTNFQCRGTSGSYGYAFFSLVENGVSNDHTTSTARAAVQTNHYYRQGDPLSGSVTVERTTSASGSGTTSMDFIIEFASEDAGYTAYISGGKQGAASWNSILFDDGAALTLWEVQV